MPITTAPCDWPIQPCGPLPPVGDPEGTAEEEAEAAAYQNLKDAATEILWKLSGRQYGCCEVVLRPCRRTCAGPGPNGPWGAYLQDGKWYNLSCNQCGDSCSCSEVCELVLPGAVCEVTEVKLDGVILDDESYRVDNYNRLVRTSGGCWPTCQEMTLADTEPGTWSVTGTFGIPVPAGGQRAAGELMSELWKACCNDGACCLPKRVQSLLTPAGPIPLLDPMLFLKEGKTGLYFVDLWLSAVNPQARPAGARVMSPDSPLHRTVTWP